LFQFSVRRWQDCRRALGARNVKRSPRPGNKPNILFVLMDNLGYGEVGSYGGGVLRGAPLGGVSPFFGHLKTLAEYPPVQGGASFDMSNIVQEFLKRPILPGDKVQPPMCRFRVKPPIVPG
jgi:hypothetical protein